MNKILNNKSSIDYIIMQDKNEIENVYDIFSQALNNSNIHYYDNNIRNYLHTGKITFEQLEIEYIINIKKKYNMSYLSLCIKSKTSIAVIEMLERFIDLIETPLNFNYVLIETNNCISEYFCTKLYKYINKFDRILRQLFYNIYFSNFGIEYFEYIYSNLDNMTKQRVNATLSEMNSRKRKNIDLFYALDYSQMESILFNERWTEKEQNIREEIFSNYPDNISKASLLVAINELKPKSDWERLFSNKVKIENIDIKLEQIRTYRNTVAHCRKISKLEYVDAVKILKELIKQLQRAIQYTLEEDFYIENTILILKSLFKIPKEFYEVIQKLKGNKGGNL